ncbi:YbaB/EbfC family nucleoid-associated protein [Simkania negevensis]|uniref:Nucleoid-associated protein JYU14_01780 n=1 Tax=Simkania negevensis TaxID=83561 RepID=A0ABS3ATG1_9BACT|nr:YbaB/EbfC family nucleoid-associated protein [Simkania negevensis]
MGTGFAKKKKQAKMLQQQFAKMQEELKSKTYTGQAGNGLVKMTINGENDLTDVSINPDCVDPDDIEGLEDLIKAAYNDAAKQSKETSDEMMPGLEGGMPDLGSFGL